MGGGCNTDTHSLSLSGYRVQRGSREVDERPRKERLWSSIAGELGGIPTPMRLEGSLLPMKLASRSPWPPACPREGD